jgi:serine/threonine protein kinase
MSTVWNAATLIGTRLGSCVLERTLGVGGMGAVYLARQERPRRQVAVKVLRPLETGDPRAWSVFLARFRREADATAALDHANIVPIYEFGEQDGIAYLVMPYLADGSLDALLARAGPMPLDRATAYLAQAADALDYAHAHGIIHRDVKPSNLLLHPDGRLLLADFGIARPLDHADLATAPGSGPRLDPSAPDDPTLTHAGATIGTPQYMAPEQIRGEAVSAATDIYALGILAYALLGGRPPFDGAATDEILRQQVVAEPWPLRSLRPDLPRPVEEVVLWALAKQPADRPANAGIFVQALEEAGRGRTLGALFGRVAPPRTPSRLSMRPRTGVDGPASPHTRSPADDWMWTSAPTVYGAGTPGGSGDLPPSGPPIWPLWTPADAPPPPPRRRAPAVLRLAAVAAVVLGILALAPVLWALASGFVLASGPSAPARSAPSPTATATATPSPTPVADWLRVAPASVSLGCAKRNKSAQVVLRNLGPEQTGWAASVPFLGGVSVSPSHGSSLPSGRSVTITVTNTSLFVSHQDTITFKATDELAGSPASLSYTTQSC